MKYLGYIYKICVIILTVLVLIVFVGIGMEKSSVLVYYFFGEYPAQGNYYIHFNENNDISVATFTYQQNIFTEEKIDTENLKIYPDLINRYRYEMDKENAYDNNKLRELLLSEGLATIIDNSKATAKEIEAQNSAEEKKIGCWSQKEANATAEEGQTNTEFSVLKLINWLKKYYKSIAYLLFRWTLGAIGITFIISCLIKFARRNNVDIIFWGEVASGKTTIASRLKYPEITKTELLQITSTKGTSINKGERIALGKKDIYPFLIDNPGQQYDKMFDKVNKNMFSNPHQILLITIALNHDKDAMNKTVDNEYIGVEISKAVQIITITKGSKKLNASNRIIILFINKCDILYENEQEMFSDKHKEIVNSYLEKAFDYEMLLELENRYRHTVHRVYGSALEGWGMSNIKKIIEKI